MPRPMIQICFAECVDKLMVCLPLYLILVMWYDFGAKVVMFAPHCHIILTNWQGWCGYRPWVTRGSPTVTYSYGLAGLLCIVQDAGSGFPMIPDYVLCAAAISLMRAMP